MKNSRIFNLAWQLAGGFLVVGLLLGCDGHGPHHTTVKETIAAYEGPIPNTDREDRIDEVSRVLVAGQSSASEKPIFTQTRLDKLTSTPCSSCHQSALPAKQSQLAHWNRTLDHASREVMTYTTCHDADSNMEQLHLLSGQQVEFDHVYQLCGQCHYEQVDDWRGGAHGKRLNGWAGERVISNCTSCHDPHRPGFPKRFPSFAPTPPESRLMDRQAEGGSSEHE